MGNVPVRRFLEKLIDSSEERVDIDDGIEPDMLLSSARSIEVST